jgi:hypothetical protein
MGIGDWGFGDWGLGIGDWAQSPIPNPQSPIPNPHLFYLINNNNKYIFLINKIQNISKNDKIKKINY